MNEPVDFTVGQPALIHRIDKSCLRFRGANAAQRRRRNAISSSSRDRKADRQTDTDRQTGGPDEWMEQRIPVNDIGCRIHFLDNDRIESLRVVEARELRILFCLPFVNVCLNRLLTVLSVSHADAERTLQTHAHIHRLLPMDSSDTNRLTQSKIKQLIILRVIPDTNRLTQSKIKQLIILRVIPELRLRATLSSFFCVRSAP
jgi:hypothetical protein